MGLRLSCIRHGSVSPAASPPAPARVIATDGSLKDLPTSSSSSLATVSDVLGLDGGSETAASSYFVCNADALYFNEHPPALAPGDVLRPGQMYFVLPADQLDRPLSAADMAALAVRASAALASSGKPQRQQEDRRWRGGKQNKKKAVRVMPVHEDAEDDGVDLFNEKLNELTLGQVGLLLMSPAKKGGDEKFAAAERSLLKRALSIIREDAE
jgi:hypothetical protein